MSASRPSAPSSSKPKRAATRASSKPVNGAPAPLGDGAKQGMALASAYMQGWTSVGEEAARFASRRLERHIETARALAGCESPLEAWSVWTDAAKVFADDYAEEVKRMGEVYAEAAAAQTEGAGGEDAATPKDEPPPATD